LDDAVPKCDLPGHSWGEIINNTEATWIANYKDKNSEKSTKYVFLAANSKFKGMNDFKKYEKARRLKDFVGKIKEDYSKKLEESTENRQLGVATYLIDKLALRVGNEKGDDEADTVGCCSLRVEHIIIEEENYIVLDFLGKDSMRYYNKIQVDPKVHENLKRFVKGKDKTDNLFDLVNVIGFLIF
jgi:DNA topoisomerase-1